MGWGLVPMGQWAGRARSHNDGKGPHSVPQGLRVTPPAHGTATSQSPAPRSEAPSPNSGGRSASSRRAFKRQPCPRLTVQSQAGGGGLQASVSLPAEWVWTVPSLHLVVVLGNKQGGRRGASQARAQSWGGLPVWMAPRSPPGSAPSSSRGPAPGKPHALHRVPTALLPRPCRPSACPAGPHRVVPSLGKPNRAATPLH